MYILNVIKNKPDKIFLMPIARKFGFLEARLKQSTEYLLIISVMFPAPADLREIIRALLIQTPEWIRLAARDSSCSRQNTPKHNQHMSSRQRVCFYVRVEYYGILSYHSGALLWEV
ncbi:hypothetical protein ATANTOWER_017872 [Ataeniobius toweri]|uniref:Uncharacterized protein n=1 Tax=Ataeniobius toweri TaxID=208326 RepID=A0ABU7B8L4_9TELE|nr:hypothetical protein [Ataeniobius toweri]